MYVHTLKQDNYHMRKYLSKKNNKKPLRTQHLKASNKNGNQPERRKKEGKSQPDRQTVLLFLFAESICFGSCLILAARNCLMSH